MTETVADPEVEAAAPTPPPPAPSARSRWLWRLGAAAVLALAVGILVWGGSRAEVTQPTGTGDLVVDKISPGDGAKALRQTEVGADLKAGFDGRLTINGTAIPEEQMQGVVDPSSPEAARLPPEQQEKLRPNNRNRVYFLPGPGKVIEKLPQGEVVITVTYFRDGAPTLDRGSLTWTIDVD
ncbi:MAG TPA: hypothetical protein VHK88_10485 [Aquihabitans sp.]|jgi:hypothetical protein|nr:hypothetical protein [Aquihabitans sp.]